jgi:hypothetical protein
MMTRRPFAIAAALSVPLFVPALSAQKWTPPTPEELSMTSIPEVPGAPAVYLYKEESADDGTHVFRYYVRLKVLNERGKEYANVELPFVSGDGGFKVFDVEGRTIHPDGSIVPFTDKPYEKVVEKSGGYKVKEKVFTLPAVDVGSIIEYRYALSLDDAYYQHPDWYIQSELYTRKAHYMWRPTNAILSTDDGKDVSSSIAWTPILPADAKVVERPLANGSQASYMPTRELILDVHDVPPLPKEEDMPPINSLSYRVLFYYTDVRSPKEFWDQHGKRWSKASDKFIGPNNGVKSYVATLVKPADSQDQTARKLYAAVMELENTDFTRERTTSEEKASGLKKIETTDDILLRKRGNGDQLTELFIAMCRAAGLKAYLMGVADRSERIFLPVYLSMRQIDDYIAIVNIDGKEVYFDPGQRYCEPERLTWKHTLNGGIRQSDAGPVIASAPGSAYTDNRISRLADLTLDEHGVATGTVTYRYTGDAALHWRQEALRGDETSLKEALRSNLEHMLPGGLEIEVQSVANLTAPEKTLVVIYGVKGPIGSPTGKRLLVTGNLFESNEKPRFTSPKREIAIDMRYPSYVQEAVKYTFPASMAIEAKPTAEKDDLPKQAVFSVSSTVDGNSITISRVMANGQSIFLPASYNDLRAFYSKIETKDQEPVIFTRASTTTASAETKPTGN